MNDIKNTILKEIESGRVQMTPRVYFSLKLLQFTTLSIAILVLTVLIFNFIFFHIRINSHTELLWWGPRGIRAFLYFFPWPLLTLDILLIIALQWFMRQFRFGYKTPTLYLVSGLITISFVCGLILDQTHMNDALHNQRRGLPSPMRAIFESLGKPPGRGSGICKCEIVRMEGSILFVEDVREGSGELKVVPESDDAFHSKNLTIGDIVYIAGDEKDGVIHAFGIIKEGEGRHHFAHPPVQKKICGSAEKCDTLRQ